jgi:hypothetical protein
MGAGRAHYDSGPSFLYRTYIPLRMIHWTEAQTVDEILQFRQHPGISLANGKFSLDAI